MTKTQREVIPKKKVEQLIIRTLAQAEKALTQYKISTECSLNYSTVYKAITRLQADYLVRVADFKESKRGLQIRNFYVLTFHGFINYLAKEQKPKKLEETIQRQGELLNYPIFTEAKNLSSQMGSVYQTFLDTAREVHSEPRVTYWKYLGTDTSWKERTQILNDENLKLDFAERFFARISQGFEGKIPNVVLHKFAQEMLKTKIEREVKPLEKAIELFRSETLHM